MDDRGGQVYEKEERRVNETQIRHDLLFDCRVSLFFSSELLNGPHNWSQLVDRVYSFEVKEYEILQKLFMVVIEFK